jgi:hypothetical protein
MSGSGGYSITIKAVDQTTGILDKINARIAGPATVGLTF